MQYMGGKHRQGKHIGAFVNRWRKPGQVYWEPFVGTMGALCHIESGVGPVYASDFCGPLVALLCAVQGGWIPPAEEITEEQYRWYKEGNGEPRMRAFVGFGCSYGGKWFGGLARDKAGTAGRRKGRRNFTARASDLLVKRMSKIPKGTAFLTGDYARLGRIWFQRNTLVYCDPPYRDHIGHWGKRSRFDSDQFFGWVREMSDRGHDMLVSEYAVPADFVKVVDLKNKRNFCPRPLEGGPRDAGETGEGLFVLAGSGLHQRWLTDR